MSKCPEWLLDGASELRQRQIRRDYEAMQRASRSGRHIDAAAIGTDIFCQRLLDSTLVEGDVR